MKRKTQLFSKCILIIIIHLTLCFTFILGCKKTISEKDRLYLNELDYFEMRGLNILVFSNWYNDNFSDSKMSGIEIIHHGVRTATNGDIRLSPTPEQWDNIPEFKERKVFKEENRIKAFLSYSGYDFSYSIEVKSVNKEIIIGIYIDKPLPVELREIAGFNLEFLPSAYFEKTYLMDGGSGVFPLYPSGSMYIAKEGKTEPEPIVSGHKLILAPDDPLRTITIDGGENKLSLYDGRNKAQNGWFVVRSIIPSNKSGKVLEWRITASTLPNWVRQPVIAHSQVGYHPKQKKIALVELDKSDNKHSKARLLKIMNNGNYKEYFKSNIKEWGRYLRYNYFIFDFSEIDEQGLYVIEYDNIRTKAFRIDNNVYVNAWHPTLDIFFPVQMDHMFVNEAYRVWHGAAHLDDALQAPVNHIHFDLYAQGPATDSPYKPGEHIPGLNIGGWFDAGDFDIRTQSQYSAVQNLVQIWEKFKPYRDETTINQKNKYTDIHHPDGKPDILQQVEHGVLGLIAQHRSVGHAINGIIVSSLTQYTHLGDALSITDNLIYNKALDSLESNGFYSGTFDDRWAFTSKSTPLNFGSIAALSSASRVLRGYNDQLADECLLTSIKVWEEEHTHKPDLFQHGNTTGGPLEEEELNAAVELYISTKESKYLKRIIELWPVIEKQFDRTADKIVKVLPYLDKVYVEKLKSLTISYRDSINQYYKHNPFGVPIFEGGWAGNGRVIYFGLTNYSLHKAFPEIIDKEFVFRAVNYIYGCHPESDISFVSGVGTYSKKVAYGNNRADFSFISGGIVPGILILPPDFPENKEDWPFLWGENEYVINLGAAYILLVQEVNDLLNENSQ